MNPQSPYAIAKLAAYQANKLYRNSYGLFTCSGILFNHESERRGEEFVTRKITRWLGRYRSGKSVPTLKLGNLHSKRDWGYSADYTKIMTKIIEHNEPDDFVIGTGNTITVQQFLTDAFICAGLKKDSIEFLVEVDESLKRPSEVPFLCASSLKAKKSFDIDLKDSYANMVCKMVEHDMELGKRET